MWGRIWKRGGTEAIKDRWREIARTIDMPSASKAFRRWFWFFVVVMLVIAAFRLSCILTSRLSRKMPVKPVDGQGGPTDGDSGSKRNAPGVHETGKPTQYLKRGQPDYRANRKTHSKGSCQIGDRFNRYFPVALVGFRHGSPSYDSSATTGMRSKALWRPRRRQTPGSSPSHQAASIPSQRTITPAVIAFSIRESDQPISSTIIPGPARPQPTRPQNLIKILHVFQCLTTNSKLRQYAPILANRAGSGGRA